MSKIYKSQIEKIKCPICGQVLYSQYIEPDSEFDYADYYCDNCEINLTINCHLEEEDNMNNRIDAIAKYAKRRDEEIANKKREVENREEFLKQTILGWSDRIKDLIDTANACLENNIKFWHDRANDRNYDHNYFVTDACSHILGFECNRYKPSKITRIGKEGGGCCHFDVYTDGITIAATGSDCLWALERFVESFDKFETKFYAYVDRVCQSK